MTNQEKIDAAKIMWENAVKQAHAIIERLSEVSDSLDDLYSQMPAEQVEQLKKQIELKQQEMQQLVAESEAKYLEKLRKLDPRY